MVGYPGSKGASGVVQRILSLMPRHDRYIEPFLGGGIILEKKRPARVTLAADLDEDLVAHHRHTQKLAPLPGDVTFLVDDAFRLLERLSPSMTRADLVYMDPPYHPDTRVKKRVYKFELTDTDHWRLLDLARGLDANVMISGYRCPLYDKLLAGWHREDFNAMTRGGVRTESVWCNFKPGATYHDTRFLGDNYRERERIKRKRARWLSRFVRMDGAERAVIMEALEAAMTAATSKTAVSDDAASSAAPDHTSPQLAVRTSV